MFAVDWTLRAKCKEGLALDRPSRMINSKAKIVSVLSYIMGAPYPLPDLKTHYCTFPAEVFQKRFLWLGKMAHLVPVRAN